MNAQLEELRKQLAEEQRGREEERQRRESAEAQILEERRRREEEERRREAAEALTSPTDLSGFLWACHRLSLAIQVVTDPTQTTKGDTAKATRRSYPSHIVPWEDFIHDQAHIWDTLQKDPAFHSKKQFASLHQLEYVQQKLSPIAAEMDLRYFERDTVESQVKTIVDEIYGNEALRQGFQLRGPATFESHINLGTNKEAPLSTDTQQTTAGDNASLETTSSVGRGKKPMKKTNAKPKEPVITRGQADRFCIYRQEDKDHVPVMAIEYKAPHKLTCEEITTGLAQEIEPARDVIDKDGNDDEFFSRRLATVVITQLFSYMVKKNIQYGYVCTGEAFVFLHILNDPSIVQYAVCIPNSDVQMDQNDDFYFTAVAQVVAFTLRALTARPPPQNWSDAVAELGIWPVEYEEVLAQTPVSKRQKGRPTANRKSPTYYGKESRDPYPPHMKLRSRSRTPPSSPSPFPAQLTNSSSGRGRASRGRGSRATGKGTAGKQGSGQHQGRGGATVTIKDRAYCSQGCIIGLRDGGPLDPLCPNFEDHRRNDIPTHSFHNLIRRQLANDRGIDADCCPLYKQGSCGALFKVRLSSHGFTMVAKGVTRQDLHALQHERDIYDVLRDIQGIHVPVCLGIVGLEPRYPYYYNGGAYTHMLCLSWAGRPLSEGLKSYGISQVSDSVLHILREIHQRGVLHGDAEPRNILCDETHQCLMMVDFERASIRHPLPNVSSKTRKRKLGNTKNNDLFSSEIKSARYSLTKLRPQPLAIFRQTDRNTVVAPTC